MGQVRQVDWGNGQSHRLLVEVESLGFGVAHTIVRAGSMSRLQYRRHLEACYCISGAGQIISETGEVHAIEPGVLYALDRHDAHVLVAAESEDMHLVSVPNPALEGHERHVLDDSEFSAY
jgi:L-ectoine synthase